MNICYFELLQNHYFLITNCYYIVTTPLFLDYCFIIPLLLHFNIHYFKLLRGHYYMITTYYCHITTHYWSIIASLLFDYYIGPFHYCILTTYLLLHHYYGITALLLPNYYPITTIDWFIITWSILRSINLWLLPLLPLLLFFITPLLTITTITTITFLPNLQMSLPLPRWNTMVVRRYVPLLVAV